MQYMFILISQDENIHESFVLVTTDTPPGDTVRAYERTHRVLSVDCDQDAMAGLEFTLDGVITLPRRFE